MSSFLDFLTLRNCRRCAAPRGAVKVGRCSSLCWASGATRPPRSPVWQSERLETASSCGLSQRQGFFQLNGLSFLLLLLVGHLQNEPTKGYNGFDFFFVKMEPPRPEIDVKWDGFQDTSIRFVFRFVESFRLILALKLEKNYNIIKKCCFKNSIWVLYKAKFDAEFESIENSARKSPKKVIGRKP
jgi:hypothetical protein